MIPLFKPTYDVEATLTELRKVFKSGWTGMGPLTEKFEKMFSQYIGGSYCVATNSCTAALHLAIKNLRLPFGAKVLTTPITFISTNHALLYNGLTPVFCDVEKDTGNMDLSLACERIKRGDISAVIVVHLAGYPCDMGALLDIEIPIIEDCAHALGSKYRGMIIGSFGGACCWSFHAVKNLSIGDGGAITTELSEDREYYKRARWLGIDKSTFERSFNTYAWEYLVDDLGYKYHMNDITAAIGIVNLPLVEKQNERRKEIADYYRNNIKNVRFPVYAKDRESSYHFFPVFIKDRDKIIKRLSDAGVSFGLHYKPNYEYPMYKNFERINDCNNAKKYAAEELTLPIGPSISDLDIERVVEVFNE
jgi:perosamine synthetase